MPETLYNQIINAKLDYLGDSDITKTSRDTYSVQQWSVGAGGRWTNVMRNIFVEQVNRLLGSQYRQIISETFTGTWRYRERYPDESTFKDWLRVYYNELESHAEYKSEERSAYQSIIGLLLESTGESIEHLKHDVACLCTDDKTTERQFDLYDELVGAIADYQDEQKKGTSNVS